MDLIEHKSTGILATLDDQCKLPKATDERFAGALYKNFDANSRFSASPAQKRDFSFCIDHYAGPVVYSTSSFVDKNKDELPKEAEALFLSSTSQLVKGIFEASQRSVLLEAPRKMGNRRYSQLLLTNLNFKKSYLLFLKVQTHYIRNSFWYYYDQDHL